MQQRETAQPGPLKLFQPSDKRQPAPRTRRIGSLGNQNNRKTGLYSRLDPLTDDELATLARQAVAAGDHIALFAVARSIRAQGRRTRVDGRPTEDYYTRAAGLRGIARQIEARAATDIADSTLDAHSHHL